MLGYQHTEAYCPVKDKVLKSWVPQTSKEGKLVASTPEILV